MLNVIKQYTTYVGGGMLRHLFNALSWHSKRESLGVSYLMCWSVLLMSMYCVVTCSPEWSNPILGCLSDILGEY